MFELFSNVQELVMVTTRVASVPLYKREQEDERITAARNAGMKFIYHTYAFDSRSVFCALRP